MNEEVECKTHPDAPHGFVRNASHTEDRLMCECEYWEEPKMNERLKQLCEHAKVYATECTKHFTGGEPVVWMDYYTEKFAELIVLECAEQIISKGTDWVDFAPSQTGVRPEYWDMAQQIKQHFGVEL